MSVNDLFQEELKVVNMGLESFYEDLKGQGVSAIHVQWKPVAGGNPRMAARLKRLKPTR